MTEPQPSDSPATDAAYAFVIPSYDWMMQRLDAANARLQTLATATFGLTFGGAAFVGTAASDAEFDSVRLYAALTLAVVGVLVAWGARLLSQTVLLDPGLLFEQHLDQSEHEFKLAMIEFAGANFQRNQAMLSWLYRAAVAVAALLVTEFGLLAWWGLPQL